MTDINKQALEALDEIDRHYDSMETAEWLATGAFDKCLETIRAALEPKPSVDVEALKEELWEVWVNADGERDIQDVYIDHLHSQGYLNQGWQPIESAPKDGTEILGYLFEDYSPQSIYWRDDTNGWYCVAIEKHTMPTHWMPLPQPPSEDK